MRKGLVPVLILFLGAAPSLAQFNPERLGPLIESGHAEDAYRQAVAERDTLEGDPLYDFYYGWAAVDSGRADEGVFALSRVVLQQPENARARLELARGYYLLGEIQRARQEFETVLEQSPPETVRASVRRFLEAIEARESAHARSASAYAQVSVGYDTNINSAPADDPYEFLFGQETEWASEHASAFGQVEAGGQYTSPLSPLSAWFARADGSWRSHADGSRYNNGYATAQGGYSRQNANDQYRAAAIAQHYVVEDDTFRTLYGLTGDWSRRTRPDRLYGANLTLARLGYPDQPHRDGTLASGGLHVTGNAAGGIWFVAGFVGGERADEETDWTDASVSRLFGGGRAGFQWSLGRTDTATVSALLQYSRYEGKWPWPEEHFESTRREDTYGAVDMEYKRALRDGLSLVANVGLSDNASSVASFDYQRHQARLGVRYER